MTDEERAELCKKLDKDMEEYLAGMEAKAKNNPTKYEEGWTEDNWEKEMESHPFFTQNDTLLEQAAKGELDPMMKGLQDLKYSPDENTKEELAKNYKEDGNFQFKLKKYRLSIAAYTEGIKCKSDDAIIHVQLITNRAAAQYHLGNFRSSFNDCAIAIKFKPDHFKAIKRGAQCCYQLKRYPDCIKWSKKALELEANDNEIQAMLEKVTKEQKEFERNARRELTRKNKKSKEELKLLKGLKSRGVKLQEVDLNRIDFEKEEHVVEVIEKLTPILPAAFKQKVHFSAEAENTLIWPVLFMYPEYGETDLIEEFEELGQTFSDHLQAMFGHGIGGPVWDISNKYHPERLIVYFEDRITNPEKVALVPVKNGQNSTLSEALSDPRFQIVNGLPTFIVLVDKSHYETFMVKSYENPHLK